MHIFGLPTPTADEIWSWYGRMTGTPELWQADGFAAAAKACGFKAIAERRGYYSFKGPGKLNVNGQSIVNQGLIEEVRLFIGQVPHGLSDEMWQQDRDKLKELRNSYSERLRAELGQPRLDWNNEIYESEDWRLRLLLLGNVCVVLSSLAVQKQLGIDYWLVDEN